MSGENLRREVFGRAAERVRRVRILHIEFAEPEITQRNMARVVQQNVLRLQIPVDDIKLMQVLQRQKQLRAVKAAPLLVESLFAL